MYPLHFGRVRRRAVPGRDDRAGDGIAIQNANYDATGRQIIVKGKLDGFDGPQTVTVRNLATGAVLGTQSTSKQFSFFIPVPAGHRRALRAAGPRRCGVKSTEVRHGPGLCARYTVQLTGKSPTRKFLTRWSRHVDGITYTTTADANGNYTLPITTANLNQLLKIEAAGTSETGTPIEFTNLIGSFSRVLDEQTSTGTAKGNVTNVTTASYVLVLQANDGQEPDDRGATAHRRTAVDATKLLQLAAIIKLIVDEGYDLPPGETNLIDFISDPEAVAQYVATTLSYASRPRRTSTPRRRILADSNLVAGFSAQDIPERYFAIPAANPLHGAQRLHPRVRCRPVSTGRLLDFFSGQGKAINAPFSVADRERSSARRLCAAPSSSITPTLRQPHAGWSPDPAEQATFAGEQLNVVQRSLRLHLHPTNDGVLADPVLREVDYLAAGAANLRPTGTVRAAEPTKWTDREGHGFAAFEPRHPADPVRRLLPLRRQVGLRARHLGSFAVYSPGTTSVHHRHAAGAVLPVTAWGDVQTFTGTGSGTVTGAISGVSPPGPSVPTLADRHLSERMGAAHAGHREPGPRVRRVPRVHARRRALRHLQHQRQGIRLQLHCALPRNAAGEIWQGEINSWSWAISIRTAHGRSVATSAGDSPRSTTLPST